MQFVQYLKDHPESIYDDIAGMSGVSKARVSQMIALIKRLPDEIVDYFPERRLRPLTLMATDGEKINRFNEMREALRVA